MPFQTDLYNTDEQIKGDQESLKMGDASDSHVSKVKAAETKTNEEVVISELVGLVRRETSDVTFKASEGKTANGGLAEPLPSWVVCKDETLTRPRVASGELLRRQADDGRDAQDWAPVTSLGTIGQASACKQEPSVSQSTAISTDLNRESPVTVSFASFQSHKKGKMDTNCRRNGDQGHHPGCLYAVELVKGGVLQCVRPTVRHGGGRVMLWGSYSGGRLGDWRCQGLPEAPSHISQRIDHFCKNSPTVQKTVITGSLEAEGKPHQLISCFIKKEGNHIDVSSISEERIKQRSLDLMEEELTNIKEEVLEVEISSSIKKEMTTVNEVKETCPATVDSIHSSPSQACEPEGLSLASIHISEETSHFYQGSVAVQRAANAVFWKIEEEIPGQMSSAIKPNGFPRVPNSNFEQESISTEVDELKSISNDDGITVECSSSIKEEIPAVECAAENKLAMYTSKESQLQCGQNSLSSAQQACGCTETCETACHFEEGMAHHCLDSLEPDSVIVQRIINSGDLTDENEVPEVISIHVKEEDNQVDINWVPNNVVSQGSIRTNKEELIAVKDELLEVEVSSITKQDMLAVECSCDDESTEYKVKDSDLKNEDSLSSAQQECLTDHKQVHIVSLGRNFMEKGRTENLQLVHTRVVQPNYGEKSKLQDLKIKIVHTGSKPYQCTECKKNFTCSRSLKHHQRIHTGEKPYQCSECGLAFRFSAQFKYHQRIHIETKTYQCAECGKTFSWAAHLKQHQKIHTGEKPYECRECSKSFSCSRNLKHHQRIHTGEKPFQCPECGKMFSRAETLKQHQRIHTGDKPYQCTECGLTFRFSAQFKYHQRIHSEAKIYQCVECTKCFSWAAHLKQHQKIHLGDKPYQCNECGKMFSCSRNLTHHQRIHTGEKPYHCPECGKTFSRAETLKQHQRIHTGDKPYQCPECGLTFRFSGQFNFHVKVHTEKRTYECPECAKSFSRAANLKQHQRIHTGEKPYRCSECGNAFSRAGTLKHHLRIHTGDKPYHCSECGKAFSQAETLKQHQRIHTGDKPYKCDECGRTFRFNGQFKRHLRIHTGERPHRCVECGKTFSWATYLKLHQKIHTTSKSKN